jgi:hypothetical protein
MGYEPVTIREAAQLEVLLFVGLAFVGGLVTIYWGFQTYQFGRVIRDTPPEPIQSVAMGRTEITGEILPATRVYDQPFTEGRCVYGELKVKEYRDTADDDNDKEWKTVQTDSFSAPFYIDDGTGQMLVEPNDDTIYEIDEEHSVTISVGGGESPPGPVGEFLGSGSSRDSSPSDDGGGIRDRLGGVLGRFGLFGGDDDEIEDRGGDPDAVDVDQRDSESGGVEHIERHELGSVSPTGNKRRYVQTVLPLSDEGYVFGGATRPDLDESVPGNEDVLVRTDPGTGEFIVSDRGEFDLGATYRNRAVMYIAAAVVASVFILAVLVQILVTGPLYGIEVAMP